MPQLDLFWFFINFLTAWTIIPTIYLIISNNNWLNNNHNNENNNNNTQLSNNWNW
uniref:ATP synthase F0 subunit 8 n=1 Tax=Phyrella fragilis TaxID=1238287 RepID=A0A8F6HBM5_9ECHN|nr:ATP synthase F0 subunit 8 [Phyrella fragilis]